MSINDYADRADLEREIDARIKDIGDVWEELKALRARVAELEAATAS